MRSNSPASQRPLASLCLLLTAAAVTPAMAATSSEPVLEEIIVTSTRIEEAPDTIPAAMSLVGQDDIQQGRQLLGMDESLNRVPGVFFQDRYNFAQDLRVAIRGFGTRAAFGIRGIKVMVDDIPSTLADGQSGVDDIDLGSVDRIEVIRGPSSSLYGTASGGVISLFTEDGPATPFVETRFNIGDYDQQKYQLKLGGQFQRVNYLINGSYLTMDGYRQHAEVEHTVFNSKFRYDIDPGSDFGVLFNAVDSPMANDPGGLTAAQAAADPRQAYASNLNYDAGESLRQQKVGFIYRKSIDDHQRITLRNYYLWRNFQNFLPIANGVVEFSRFFYGGGAQYSNDGTLFDHGNRFTAGFDIDLQRDDRQRFLNNSGVKGDMTLNQLEAAESYGFYLRDEFTLLDNLALTFGARYDIVDLSVNDRFLVNGDQSSSLHFGEFSHTIGALWSVTEDLHLYATMATSFETPTFTELANPAQELNIDLGGFNDVKAQTATSYEIGAKGTLQDGLVQFDLAAFTMQVNDEITNVINIGSHAFFENADTDRKGIEATLVVKPMHGMTLTTSYTYSDFTFDRFQADPTVEGNRLPGLPDNQLFMELAYTHDSGWYVTGDLLYVDSIYANNANSEADSSYTVVNLRGGYTGRIGNWELSPYVGLNNLFDQQYNANIRINAFGGRYYEPAPDFNAYGGISARYRFAE